MTDNKDTRQQTLTGDFAAQDSETSPFPLRTRAGLGTTFDGDRDTYDVLGYDEDPTVDDYWERYLRQDIAKRIVDAPSTPTWRERPQVTDDDNDEQITDFERDVRTLWRDHELKSRFDAVDRLSGIGHFGVLIVGLKDGRPRDQPVNAAALSSPDDIAYLMPIGEDRVDDWQLVDDDRDDRFGLPETYDIDFSNRDRLNGSSVSFASDGDVREVHHERVIHVPAGNTLDNVLMGRPRLEAVYNRLHDIEKVVGASAEMMWRAADYGLAIKTDAENASKLGKREKKDLENELQKWFHGMQPFLRLSGFDVERLGGETPKPSGPFETLLSLVAGETGIPQRILTGSERGELASTQDRASWLGRISERQTNFAEPKLLRPFIDRMTDFGIVAEPAGNVGDVEGDGRDYNVDWPSLFELSAVEKAEMAKNLASALKQSRDPAGGEPIMSRGEKREKIFDMDPEYGSETALDETDDADSPPTVEDLLPDPESGDDAGGGDAPPDSDDDGSTDGSPSDDPADQAALGNPTLD
jgi:hypothetical protein